MFRTEPEHFRYCPSCRIETYEPIDNCRRCSGPLQCEKLMRTGGALAIGIGIFGLAILGMLILGIGLVFVVVRFTHPDHKPSGSMLDEPGFYGGLILFGGLIASLVLLIRAGRAQLRTGRRSKEYVKPVMTTLAGSIILSTLLFTICG